MQQLLINAAQSDELRVAIVDQNKNQLIDLDIEQCGYEQKKSNIYKGKISSIEPSLGAVFVDYGVEKHGFLPIKDISKEYFLSNEPIHANMDIKKILKVGQELVVQVDKEERGNKGAALSTFISLAGSYLVLMPNNPRAGGISRRIEGEDREILRASLDGVNVPEGMSVIIRTAGVGRSSEELNWDLQFLLRYWEAIKQAAIAKPGPYLIHQESDVVIRAVRDYLKHNISEIIIDDESTFNRVQNYISQVRPDYVDRLRLYDNPLPLFSQYRIEQQIEQAFQREVHLPSGGSLVIDHTEALVAIDINSARATKGGNIEETAFNTNMEAAVEIPRQLRIRDIGGLVVIDFIDMLSTSNQRAVEDKIREAVKQDRARIQFSKISRFGLLEMSRQRLNASLNKSTQVTCSQCHGSGSIRSVESLTLAILRLIEEESIKAGSAALQVQLPLDNATYLLNEKRDTLNSIQAQTETQIIIIPNPQLHSPNYHLKLIKDEHGKNTLSYKQSKIPKAESSFKRAARRPTKQSTPAINDFLKETKGRAPTKKTGDNSLIKRIWDTIFGLNADELTTPTPAKSQPKRTISPHKRNKATGSRSNSSRDKSEPKDAATTSNQRNSNRRGKRGGRKTNSATTQNDKTQTSRRRPTKNKATTKKEAQPAATKSNSRKPRKTNTAKKNAQSPASSTPNSTQSDTQSAAKPVTKTESNTKPADKDIKSVQVSTTTQPTDTKAVTNKTNAPEAATNKTNTPEAATKANQTGLTQVKTKSAATTAPTTSSPTKAKDTPKPTADTTPKPSNKSTAATRAKPEDYMPSNTSGGGMKQIKTKKMPADKEDNA